MLLPGPPRRSCAHQIQLVTTPAAPSILLRCARSGHCRSLLNQKWYASGYLAVGTISHSWTHVWWGLIGAAHLIFSSAIHSIILLFPRGKLIHALISSWWLLTSWLVPVKVVSGFLNSLKETFWNATWTQCFLSVLTTWCFSCSVNIKVAP